MASTRMMEAAHDEYRNTIAAIQNTTGEEREELRAKLERIMVWLDGAAVGDSDRECEWASGWTPKPRRMRRATRQLVEVA